MDTVAITGAEAHGNRIEQSIILGPTCGDAVNVDDGASCNVIVTSRIAKAQDRGVKANNGSVTIERTCVHDNAKGGIQSTLGGRVVAIENVVQHNMGGEGQNGLTVIDTCKDDNPGCPGQRTSTLETKGNVVRFSGGRGLSVRDNADAVFESDYVASNDVKGSEVETTESVPVDDSGHERVSSARFHGVALVCNYSAKSSGVGAETRQAKAASLDALHDPPVVSYGVAPTPGRNAFTSNKRDVNEGANFLLTNSTRSPTRGRQSVGTLHGKRL